MKLLHDSLDQYLRSYFASEDQALEKARLDTPALGLPDIGIQPVEGRFLQALVAACRPKLAVEIGTLGGYSGIWIARGLPPGGKLLTIDIDRKHAGVARRHFEAAGVSDRIETLVGNAHQVLAEIAPRGPFGFVFIDAEKSGYPDYYAWAVNNVPEGGVICAHNAFRGGGVLEPDRSEDIEASRVFNGSVAEDPRVISTVFPAGDGTLVAVRR